MYIHVALLFVDFVFRPTFRPTSRANTEREFTKTCNVYVMIRIFQARMLELFIQERDLDEVTKMPYAMMTNLINNV